MRLVGQTKVIDYIASSSPWVVISGNPNKPYVAQNDKPMQGVLRMVNSTYQVYDGSSWIPFYETTASVALTPQAHKILDWAENKMMHEELAAKLAKENPTVADALASVKEAEERLKLVLILMDKNK
jgi:hypothetical protein